MKKLLKVPVFLILALSIFITTCDAPMGFGDPIDWEPPELVLEGADTRYVNDGTRLRGTVKDNGTVDRVILRDAKTQEQLFRAGLTGGDRWEIYLDLKAWLANGKVKDGDKIVAEVVAFDRFGNSGNNPEKGTTSILPITLIIDTEPPIFDYAEIQRTNTKRAALEETLKTLTDLETLGAMNPNGDPNGDKPEHANKYQNGMFWIKANI